MVKRSKVCVADSSVLIDLFWGRVLEDAFLLPLEWHIPDLMSDELITLSIQRLRTLGLQEDELPGDQVAELERLSARYRALSIPDAAALTLAKWKDVLLLSADLPLRNAANQESVEVHGTLWLLDEMISRQIITSETAADSLERMLNAGSRMPGEECRRRLERWRTSDGEEAL